MFFRVRKSRFAPQLFVLSTPMFWRGSRPAQGDFESREIAVHQRPSHILMWRLNFRLDRASRAALLTACRFQNKKPPGGRGGEALWKQLQSQTSEFLTPPAKV